ncbi:hypothetical protein BDR07DRAFT_481278 [Suillus spraguei]|nr:hypothetical protein BDR07DRAFT_481278 [Suillus spraguei]
MCLEHQQRRYRGDTGATFGMHSRNLRSQLLHPETSAFNAHSTFLLTPSDLRILILQMLFVCLASAGQTMLRISTSCSYSCVKACAFALWIGINAPAVPSYGLTLLFLCDQGT